jgi:Na+/H+-dicarboxylate symporter
LVQGSEKLRLPEKSSSFVLPFAAAVLKINRPITSIGKLIFVAAVYGVVLTPEKVFAFILTVWLISIATPGVPSVNSAKTFGAYVAAGIPPEGAALFEASNPLTDIGKTVVNTTAYLSAALIACRYALPFDREKVIEGTPETAAARA